MKQKSLHTNTKFQFKTAVIVCWTCLLLITFLSNSLLFASTDVFFYDLEVKINPELRRLAGTNTVHFRAREETNELRLDLVSGLQVKRITQNGQSIRYTQAGGQIIIFLQKKLLKGQATQVSVLYGGIPAPEGGKSGLVWNISEGKPWCSAAPGHQPESWWPCKIHENDPADSLHLSIITPEDLMAVTQGKLAKYNSLPGPFRRWEWHIRTAVLPSQLSFALGPYVHFVQDYRRGSQSFPLNYYALSRNKALAKQSFSELKVPLMLDCLERHLGPYPFPRAGYAFIETPGPSQGLPGLIPFNRESFEQDFAPGLLRETARQWLGHKVRFEDENGKALAAGLRGFMQVIHLECRHGQDSAFAWLETLQKATSSTNESYRHLALGVWGWQNLRYQVNNDSLFLGTIRLFSNRFANKSLKGNDIYQFFDEKLAISSKPILHQYIIQKEVPILEYAWKKRGKRYMLRYQWVGTSPDFAMSLRFFLKTREERVESGTELYEVDMTARDKANLTFDLERAWYILKESKKL